MLGEGPVLPVGAVSERVADSVPVKDDFLRGNEIKPPSPLFNGIRNNSLFPSSQSVLIGYDAPRTMDP